MLFEMTVPQFTRMLQNLLPMLDKAAAYADRKKFDVAVLLNSRLAPDQFHFIKQIQLICDTAKLGLCRLTGKEPPQWGDDEKTLSEVRTRIEKTISFLNTLRPEDFMGAETRKVTTPRWEGKYLLGLEYATMHLIPNLYFHVTTAYSILRHNGIDVGKRDYLGHIDFRVK